MNRDRLERLAAYLREGVPTHRFNMSFWADGPLEHSCGTAGCAGGWATVLFCREGLRLEKDIIPAYGEKEGIGALVEFLEIEVEDAVDIFLSSRYSAISRPITPAMVADRIEEILRRTDESVPFTRG